MTNLIRDGSALRETALYFPYISPPNSIWFRQMMVYYDAVATIVPFDYKHDPNCGPHFDEMIESGILIPVRPLEHVPWAPDFGQDFLVHIEQKAAAERRRPVWKNLVVKRSLIHVEKLGHLGDELISRGLATQASYAWYDVEGWVANDFMSYLACLVGRTSTERFLPITDNAYCAALISGSVMTPWRTTLRTATQVRKTYLDTVLPSPSPNVSFREIVRFKEKYGRQLVRFRRHLESEILLVASTPDEDERDSLARHRAEVMKEETLELAAKMRERWRSVVFGTVFPLLSAVAQMWGSRVTDAAAWVGSVSGLGAAGYSSVKGYGEGVRLNSEPLAYAARLTKNPHQR